MTFHGFVQSHVINCKSRFICSHTSWWQYPSIDYLFIGCRTHLLHENTGFSFLLIFLQIKLFHSIGFVFIFNVFHSIALRQNINKTFRADTVLPDYTSERVWRGRYSILTNQILIQTKCSCSLPLNYWPAIVTQHHTLPALMTKE